MNEFHSTNTKPIVRQAGTTVWRQIEEVLAAEILSGQLKGRLANETELAERFSVNRHTVRQAAKALAERGLVEVLHGRGTFVREDVIDYELGRQTRFAHSLIKADRIGMSEVVSSEEIHADIDVCDFLELTPGSTVVRIDSLDRVEDKVVGVCTQYFPLPRFSGIAQIYADVGRTHVALAHFGVHEFTRRQSKVTARLAEREVARQLNQAFTAPILYVESVYVDAEGRPVEYGISRFNSQTVQVIIEPDNMFTR